MTGEASSGFQRCSNSLYAYHVPSSIVHCNNSSETASRCVSEYYHRNQRETQSGIMERS